MLTKTSELRVRSVEGTSLPGRRIAPLSSRMNEEMNAGLFLSLLTPRSFLMLILSVSSSPELVALL